MNNKFLWGNILKNADFEDGEYDEDNNNIYLSELDCEKGRWVELPEDVQWRRC